MSADRRDVGTLQGSRSRSGLACGSAGPLAGKFPVKQGTYREFLRVASKNGPVPACNPLIFQLFLLEFPVQRNRELSRSNREFFGGNRD